ncbi:MAG: hypothetical protein ACKO1M_09640 [Planctomycetota bacterium]
MSDRGHVPTSLRNAPAWALARINVARRRCGLPEIEHDGRDSGPGVYWDPASPRRPRDDGQAVIARGTGRGPRVDRVLLVVAHGDAAPAAIGKTTPETIARDAFGPAAALDRERGWGLTCPDHDGPLIALGGPAAKGRLRAIDSEVGLMLDWLPDMSDRRHVQAVRMIEAGAGASVLMQAKERSTLRIGGPITVVTRARLVSVAITTNPAYRGAAALVFRHVWRDDPGLLEQQVAAVAREARFRNARGWGRVV